jgi:hypothetical protein
MTIERGYDRTQEGSNGSLIAEVAMNAVQAVALPGDRARSQAAKNQAGHRRGSPRPPLYLVPGPAADDPVAAPPASVRPAPAQPEATNGLPAGSLRLTRRGRVVVAAAAALLVTALSLGAAAAAQPTSHPAQAQHLVQVVVHPGQNLWVVAENADPGADTRLVIQRIIDLNGLTGETLQPGQRLWVPHT